MTDYGPVDLPGYSYSDSVASLLAQIADLLLGEKPDWSTLERLQAALLPARPSVVDSTPMTATEISKMVEGIWGPELEKQLRDSLTDQIRTSTVLPDSSRVTYTTPLGVEAVNPPQWVRFTRNRSIKDRTT